jgi:general secretion pathway protein H
MPTGATGPSTSESASRDCRFALSMAGSTPLQGMGARGFTLIELLVVIVILGISVAAVLPSLGLLQDDRDLDREARRAAALIEMAAEEAAMQSRDYGLRFGLHGYRFYEQDPATGAWIALAGDDILRERNLPEDLRLGLRLESRDIQLFESIEGQRPPRDPDDGPDPGPTPHVLLLSSGDTTPFELTLTRDFDDARVELSGDFLGRVEVKSEEMP